MAFWEERVNHVDLDLLRKLSGLVVLSQVPDERNKFVSTSTNGGDRLLTGILMLNIVIAITENTCIDILWTGVVFHRGCHCILPAGTAFLESHVGVGKSLPDRDNFGRKVTKRSVGRQPEEVLS